MANTINLAKVYTPILDAVYKEASLTAILDGADNLMREGFNANEIVIPKLDMSGLANYSRNSGYVNGDVNLTWETVKCGFDRGRMFSVDNLDNVETGGVAFGALAGEFIRAKVVPELDAYRFASYAQETGIGDKAETITATNAVSAIRAGMKAMDDAEVPQEGRILFATPEVIGILEDLDTTKSRAVLNSFAAIIKVPQGRFYTKITQNDGTTSGQEAGGFAKATDGLNINFMIIHPTATIQFNKLVSPKIITPEMNQDSDAWKYGYRLVGIADAYENKVAGIYCSHVAAK